MTSETSRETGRETVAAVVVTFDRADLLRVMLDALAAMVPMPDAVIVVDNASTDHTSDVLAEARTAQGLGPRLRVEQLPANVGGAGGFHYGVRLAHVEGFDRIWLMDDDVVPAPDCLGVMLRVDEACLAAVREGPDGELCEKAALRFDLTHPWVVKPKTAMVETTYRTRAAMPALVEVENVAFEGFLVRREVVDAIGLPDPSFFIFYDDCDYAVRARAAGYRIWAVRDAVLRRQLAFSQQHDLAGWKGYYMYRNLFAVHRRHGTNALVRAKPWLLALVVVLLSPLRGGRREAANVWRAVRDSTSMSTVPQRDPGPDSLPQGGGASDRTRGREGYGRGPGLS